MKPRINDFKDFNDNTYFPPPPPLPFQPPPPPF